MFKKITYFIKYNNGMVLILVAFFVLGTSVFAQTEIGQEFIGQKNIYLDGKDNTILLEADLDEFDQEYKIEQIEEDEKYYYVKYTYIDLIEKNNVWQYQVNEKIRKVSKKLKKDLGVFMAEELKEEYEIRIKELKTEQLKAQEEGEVVRTEVTEYSGLVGQTLNVVSRVFPSYNPVKIKVLESPEKTYKIAQAKSDEERVDDLARIYDDYIERMDPDQDGVLGILDNCPEVANEDQVDRDGDNIGDACDDYFTLTPVEEETTYNVTGTSSSEVASSSDNNKVAEENMSTSSEELVENKEDEQEVEVIELPISEDNNSTNTD